MSEEYKKGYRDGFLDGQKLKETPYFPYNPYYNSPKPAGPLPIKCPTCSIHIDYSSGNMPMCVRLDCGMAIKLITVKS
jgi:hypothetical protein